MIISDYSGAQFYVYIFSHKNILKYFISLEIKIFYRSVSNPIVVIALILEKLEKMSTYITQREQNKDISL